MMGAYATAAMMGLQLAQQQLQHHSAARAAREEADARAGALTADHAQRDAERAAATRRAIARQRAMGAASGLSGDGSSAAVIQALLADAAAESEYDRATLGRSLAGQDRRVSALRRSHLLDERNDLWRRGISIAGRGYSLLD